MTTLYRSPNLVIDKHEWHVMVRIKDKRVSTVYRWRPLSPRDYRWLPITRWIGRKPKGLGELFAPYKRHAAFAMESETRRKLAAA